MDLNKDQFSSPPEKGTGWKKSHVGGGVLWRPNKAGDVDWYVPGVGYHTEKLGAQRKDIARQAAISKKTTEKNAQRTAH